MCPDSSRYVQTVQHVSGQFKIWYVAKDDYVLSWYVAKEIYAFFVWKILGCHQEDIRFLGLCSHVAEMLYV